MSGGASASFIYDGDGQRVKRTLDGVTTIYVGQHYEKTLSTLEVTKYYYASGQRVAMRKAGVVSFLHTDHLGSTTLTTAVNGYQVGSTQRYELYGEPRVPVLMSTDRLYTGQVFDRNVELMYYGARYYDPALGRFVQADTIVPQPGNPQALNRYSYVLNNPLRYIDPSGHDLMIVGGWNNEDWTDPSGWKEWIMTYKGWAGKEWKEFMKSWEKATTRADKWGLMREHAIYLFNWNYDLKSSPVAASRDAHVDEAMWPLFYQLQGLKDITLLGHSKGGNLVLNFLQHIDEFFWGNGFQRPKNAVLIDALTNKGFIKQTGSLIHGMQPRRRFFGLGEPTVSGCGVNVINIYNAFDPVNGWVRGSVHGAWNHRVFEPGLGFHSHKGSMAETVLVKELQVQWDHGANWGP